MFCLHQKRLKNNNTNGIVLNETTLQVSVRYLIESVFSQKVY